MANIRFNLDKSRNDEKCIFMIYHLHNGVRVKVSTKQKINPDEWNKTTHRAFHTSEQNIFLNKVLNLIEDKVNLLLIKNKASGLLPSVQLIKNTVLEIVAPNDINTSHELPKGILFSRDKYFARFYERMQAHGDMIQAYYDVELEWNEAGVSMCPNYEAFKVAKSRYFANKKKGFKIRSI
jgi:hypothetical protein